MATQKCPKCKSSRVRLGYRPTSRFLKLFFRYHLLCDDCNWEFSGFAIPGTVPKKTRKKKNIFENKIETETDSTDIGVVSDTLSQSNKTFNLSNHENEDIEDNPSEILNGLEAKQKVKKRVRVKFL